MSSDKCEIGPHPIHGFPASFGMDWFGLRAYKEYRRWVSSADGRILDAKFGSGRYCAGRLCYTLAHDLPDSTVYGADESPELVKHAVDRAVELNLPNAVFTCGGQSALPFPDSSFDVVLNQCLENLVDYESAFAEMVRVARPGGKLIVGVPNWFCLPHTLRKKVKELVGSEYEYGREKSFRHSELKAMYAEHGLSDIEFGGFYPMHSIIRLEGFSRFGGTLSTLKVGKLGRLSEKHVIAPIDRLTANKFSTAFGYEILIKGVKGEDS